MGQLSLFGRAEIAGMRDWTAARNHCPERDAFRRERERHRAWGLRRRHAAKLRHVRNHQPAPPAAPTSRDDHSRPTTADRRPPTRPAETPQAPSARAAAPRAGAPRAGAPRAAAAKPPVPAPAARTAASRGAATKAPARAPAPSVRAVASRRDAARISPVVTPPAPAPPSRCVPQPAGPQPRRAPQPTPPPQPPPNPGTTPRRPPTPAAAPDKTSTKFRGHRMPVVTVTPGRRPIPQGPPGSPCCGPADKPNNSKFLHRYGGGLGNISGSRTNEMVILSPIVL
jgi:hypothetical protein